MGVALGWVAFALAGVASAPSAEHAKAQITYTVRMVETDGVGWREKVCSTVSSRSPARGPRRSGRSRGRHRAASSRIPVARMQRSFKPPKVTSIQRCSRDHPIST